MGAGATGTSAIVLSPTSASLSNAVGGQQVVASGEPALAFSAIVTPVTTTTYHLNARTSVNGHVYATHTFGRYVSGIVAVKIA